MNANIENLHLKSTLVDISHHFDADVLDRIIQNELSRSDRPLDSELIDAACARLMMLEGINITPENLHAYEEKLLYRIIGEALGLPFKTE